MPATPAQRKAAQRARQAAAGLSEVRGIMAPAELHGAIREAARQCAAKKENHMSKSAETSDIDASAIRQALRREFGPRRYRITRDGEINVYGVMPNSNITGWWLYGWLGDTQTLRNLGIDP